MLFRSSGMLIQTIRSDVMRIFRSADDMMIDLGYKVVKDSISVADKTGIVYEKFMGEALGTKVIAIERQDDGNYNLGCFNKSGMALGGGNGHMMSWMTMKEMKACYRKLRELRGREWGK